MEPLFVFTYPVFALLLKDGSGTIFLRHGEEIWLPLFTEDTNVLTYAARSKLGECSAVELPTPDDVAKFISNPPSRIPRAPENEVRKVVIDPMDNLPRVITLLDVNDVLAILASDSKERSEEGDH